MVELIITEKPDASKKIAEALADKTPEKKIYKKVPYYEIFHKGKRILVGCAVGHLYNLTEKGKKAWTYPVFDLEWKPSYIVSKKAAFTKNYLDALKNLAKEADSFIVACDYDTEGSLIGWNCIRFIYNKKSAKRMKFSTLTKEELIESYENAMPTLDFRQIESGETRHYLDHYYGINVSRALILAIKNSGGGFKILSSGRVQSPTLALLTQRELEIQNFKPKPYWQIFALIATKSRDLLAIHKKEKLFDEKEAKEIYKKCSGKDATVIEVIKKRYETLQPTPFNITTLQTEAYKLFGFSPTETLNIAESLYLAALISYPRTSSEKLDPRINYKAIINSISKIKDFKNLAEKILSRKLLKPKEGKKTDPAHISIHPTSVVPDLKDLDDRQKKLYSLVVKRFLSLFADPAIRESMEIDFDVNKEVFYIRGARTIMPGWIEFYEPYAKFNEIELPEVKEKEIYKIKKLELREDKTKPRARYSQGSIIHEMEKRGLGTRATRASILQTLYDRGYIKGKSIEVTELGKYLIKVLQKYVPQLTSEKLTRYFERDIELILEGKKNEEKILGEAKKILTKILTEFKKKELEIGKGLASAVLETRKAETIIGKCKNCKEGELRITYSKKNKQYFISCNKYPECKTAYSIPKYALPKPANKICECSFPIIMMIRKGKRPYEFCINPNCPKKEEWKTNKKS